MLCPFILPNKVLTLEVFFSPTVIEKENAKKQTLEQLYERRKQVVRLHKKAVEIITIV